MDWTFCAFLTNPGAALNKKDELYELVEKRRQPGIFPGYKRLADYGSDFECCYVSPYSKGAHNYDADVMILLQDWSSDDALQRSSGPSELGRDRNLPTNKTLERLLEDTYATNLFPFIKKGGLSSRIPFKDLVLAAEEFALPQIRIVAPRLVICLGKNTFNALRVAVAKSEPARGLRRCRDMASAIAEPFDIEYARHRMAIWAQAHTGAWGQSNRNKKNPGCTFKDWVEMSRIVGLKPGN